MHVDLPLHHLHHDFTGLALIVLVLGLWSRSASQDRPGFKPFQPPISFQEADKRAEDLLAKLTLEERMVRRTRRVHYPHRIVVEPDPDEDEDNAELNR